MNIALIGYGKMGKTIEKIALDRGHSISIIIDKDELWKYDTKEFISSDVAIEFSNPASAYENVTKCFDANISVVSGTTSWENELEKIRIRAKDENKTIFHSNNFSIGVNIFFEITKHLSRLMNKYSDYNAEIEEVHHIHKLDSPSGTAKSIANILLSESDRYTKWSIDKADKNNPNTLFIDCKREGEVAGIHSLKFSNAIDEISISHNAYSRDGFALGAVLAAEYTQKHSGVLTMKDMLDI